MGDSVMTKNLVSPFKALMLMAVLASIGTYGCSKIDMPDEIISAYQKAIKINPELAEAHYNLGIAYSNHVMPDEAITELKKAIEINKNYKEALFHLGMLYKEKGLLEDAITNIKSALIVDPYYESAHSNLGDIYSIIWDLHTLERKIQTLQHILSKKQLKLTQTTQMHTSVLVNYIWSKSCLTMP